MDGFHLIADCHGCACEPALLRDARKLRELTVRETDAAGLTIVGEKFHSFHAPDDSQAGVTCALLLAESHVALHTWPEMQAVTLDVYVCNYTMDNTGKAQRLFDALIGALRPARIHSHQVRRGAVAGMPAQDRLSLEYLTPQTAYGTRLGKPLAQATTPYQRIEVAESAEFGTVMRIDGAYMTSERDEFFYHECLVHPAAVAHPAPRRALIVGGGDGGAAEELLKHPSIEQVTLCEIDPAVVELSRRHLQAVHRGALDDPRVTVVTEDGFTFVRDCAEKFDLILLDLTDPASAEGSTPASSCYTEAFFEACRHALSEEGALVMHLGSPFYHPERFTQLYKKLHAIFSTVRPYSVFVPLYGAAWSMAIASDCLDPIAIEPSEADERLERRKIGDLRYYNAQLHPTLFVLPNFVQNLLK